MINELLEEEVTQKAGTRFTRDRPFDGRYSRWGFNPPAEMHLRNSESFGLFT